MSKTKAFKIKQKQVNAEILSFQVDKLDELYSNAFRELEEVNRAELDAARDFHEKTKEMLDLTLKTISEEKKSLSLMDDELRPK